MAERGRVILIGAPRSGAGMLARLLDFAPDAAPGPLCSGHVIDELPGMSVQERGFTSHRLTAADITPEAVAALHAAYVARDAVIDTADTAADDDTADAASTPVGTRVTVDWNPRLGLRLGFLAAALPDARFIIVLRRPMPTIASLSQAWRVQRFATVKDLPEWWGEPWSFGLIPDWREAIGVPPHEVCARQWAAYVTAILDDLADIDPSRWTVTSYEQLTHDPDVEVARLAEFAGITDYDLPDDLPLSGTTITPPDPRKWKGEASEISVALNVIEEPVRRFMTFRDEHAPEPEGIDDESTPTKAGQARTTQTSDGTPFSSKHTTTFPDLLGQAGSTVIVTTYKSGHVILLRRDEVGKLNTEFTSYNRPMGVASSGSRLSIGTGTHVINMSNTPALTKALDPPDVNDSVYSTRSVITTGDVAIHEMLFVEDDLWFVNTRFSCICTLDVNYSFVPQWRPPWISALAAEDRCHVNGFTLRDGVPRYATALSQTDTAHGWREMKGTAGLIIDITNNELITTGLAMPHSPRWHEDRLWVLESGKGSLATVDIKTGEVTTVAVLPGFTRGLAFLGRYALIGLSQVRESVFKDLPVTQATAERNCGVWIVDTVTGRIEGFVKFEGVVQEIFDVQVLAGRRWPTILREPTELTQNSFVLPPAALREIASPTVTGT